MLIPILLDAICVALSVRLPTFVSTVKVLRRRGLEAIENQHFDRLGAHQNLGTAWRVESGVYGDGH